MNKERKKRLEDVLTALEQQKEELESIMEEEQECFDNLTESLQQTERGMSMEDNVNDMEYALGYIDDSIDSINNVLER